MKQLLKWPKQLTSCMSQKTMLHPHLAYYRNDGKMLNKFLESMDTIIFEDWIQNIYTIQAAITCESQFKTVQVFELDQEVETGKSDRTRYYDVYSSSDSEEENLYMPESKDQQTNVQPHTVDKSDIGPDTYVVVTLSSAIGKTENLHKFIAICQSVVDDSGFLKVLFLKPIASRRDQFKISDEGEKIIAFDEIIEILPKPQILPMGDQIYYHFLEGNLPQ